MFDWGGGSLWCGDEVTRQRFDVGPVDYRLGLSRQLLERLEELSSWHDGALDWSDPPGPSPWSEEQLEQFDDAVGAVLAELRDALGPEFQIVYHRLASPATS